MQLNDGRRGGVLRRQGNNDAGDEMRQQIGLEVEQVAVSPARHRMALQWASELPEGLERQAVPRDVFVIAVDGIPVLLKPALPVDGGGLGGKAALAVLREVDAQVTRVSKQGLGKRDVDRTPTRICPCAGAGS